MSEIKVGEYIRTERGTIRKILKLDMREFEEFGNIIYETNDEDFYKEEIVKHSFNIIDLIEEGDYVNGEKVVKIVKLKNIKNIITEVYCAYKSGLSCAEKDIKTIVTKEQFKESEYVINE